MPSLTSSTMLVVVLLSATLFQHVAAAPEPMITAAAVLHQREKREMSSRLAVARQLNPYLEMCYGGENSICDIYLDKDCPTDMDNWYQCICETGYLAAEFACDECKNVYDTKASKIDDSYWIKVCSREGFTIGPLPESDSKKWASHNATVTIPLSGTTGGGGGGSSATSTSPNPTAASTTGADAEPQSSPTTSRSSTSSSSRSSDDDDITTGTKEYPNYTLTLDGAPTGTMPSPLPTTTAPLPLANAGGSGGSGGVRGFDTELGFMLSIGSAGFSILCSLVLIL
ncbi:hypothetical protein DL95DRAFT_417178 [Leptodontidium sp. 2 PMI_412]|nr:hypothetical protein DL95DRAFT_417178 [Leptodontidium sp. 2 PMI_412]